MEHFTANPDPVAGGQAVKYEADIVADRFLLAVHGTQEDIDRARQCLAVAQAVRPLPFHQAA